MDKFPDYQIRPIDTLTPYARNSRTHSPDQVAQIAASITEFGFTNPVLVDGAGNVIAGHGRLQAARMLGLTEVPCVDLSHLTAAQRKAYIIADNKLALNAGWDEELLRLEFDELTDLGFDLELTGFSLDEIDALAPADVTGDSAGASGEEYSSVFEVVVECSDEGEQESVYNMLTEKGMKCRVLSM